MFDKFDRAKVAIHNVKYSPLTKEPQSEMNSPTNRVSIIITSTTTQNNGSFVITNLEQKHKPDLQQIQDSFTEQEAVHVLPIFQVSGLWKELVI